MGSKFENFVFTKIFTLLWKNELPHQHDDFKFLNQLSSFLLLTDSFFPQNLDFGII